MTTHALHHLTKGCVLDNRLSPQESLDICELYSWPDMLRSVAAGLHMANSSPLFRTKRPAVRLCVFKFFLLLHLNQDTQKLY